MPVTLTAARHAHLRPARAALLACASALLLLCVLAGSALADSATISVLDTAGHSDPVSGVPRTFTVSGTTSAPESVYVKVRNPGPTPCAPTANTDSGDWWDGYQPGYGYERGGGANGNFSFSDVFATGMQGTYMFCIWVAGDADTSVTAINQIITFRAPTGTISATVNPSNPQPGQAATVTINGVSEAPETVYATVRAAGAPCSQTYSADYDLAGGYSSSLDDGSEVNGNFAVTDSVTESAAGNYVICLWLADSSSDITPVAGPQPIPFTVGVPYVPPVVPVVTRPAAKKKAVSKECKTARSRRDKATKKVKATKKSLLKARHKATRRKLTRRLKSQRHTLSIATAKAKVICK